MPKPYLAALLGLSSLCLSAHANQMFNLSNVTLQLQGGGSAGTLTGYFTTNDALNTIVAYNITASVSGSFAGFNYTTADSSVTVAVLPSQYFQIDSAGSVDELRLYFTSGLSANGGTINPTYSYEHEPSGGNRLVSGAVVAASAVTPEPSSLILLGTGIAGLAGLVRRRTLLRS